MLLQNKIFESGSLYGMKSDNYPFRALKGELLKIGYDFNTYDVTPPQNADLVICLDEVETYKKLNITNKKSFLIISEPPVYLPQNWDAKNHKYFDKVFTYDVSLCVNQKYVHYNFPIEFEVHPELMEINEEIYSQRHLSTLIAGAFQISKPKLDNISLLHERFVLMTWFAKNAPDDLHFFSRNFSTKQFEHFSGAGLLSKLGLDSIIKYISNRKYNKLKSIYKGSIPPLEKISKQQLYNFSFCFENIRNINAGISERIFDCFAATSVPIYYGAPDIDKWIPTNCFIDFRNFNNYSDLYNYIKKMPYKEYLSYIESIKVFMKSNSINKFKVSSYVNKIINEVNTL